MPTAQKETAVKQAREWTEKSVGLVFTDYRGLKVKQMQQLRTQLRAKGGELHVVKNTLFRLAAPDVVENVPEEIHNGPTAIAFLFENESECAKVLYDYTVSSKTLVLKGGYIGGSYFDAGAVERLAKLPPRDVLMAQVIGTIAAPLTGVVSVIDALVAGPIRTVYAVADKLGAAPAEPEEKEAEAPVAEAAAPAPAAEEAQAPEAAQEAESAPAAEAEQVSVSADSEGESAEPEAESTGEGEASTEPEASADTAEAPPEEAPAEESAEAAPESDEPKEPEE
jgi:large subunit ribosomal protein L10